MKRSEMVNKMVGHFRGAQNLGNEKAIFSYILDKMEEAGMLAPCDYEGNGGKSTTCGHQLCSKWSEEE